MTETSRVVRPAADRPSWRTVLWRTVVVTVVTTLGLWLLAAILPGFSIDSFWDALLAGFVVGIANAVVWPALAFLVVPLSVLTLGLGAIVLNALFVFLLLDLLPGVEIDGFWTALWVVIGLVIVTTMVSALLAIDDNSWLDQRVARQARRRSKDAVVTDVPGVVFIQLDGVAHAVLRRALRSGDVPTLHRWIRDGSHVLVGWETGWSSQTGVSQCGILHGSTVDMPAFRWIDKTTGEVVVSNHPKCAALIEQAHSDGNGLLAHHGSSYGNLFSGDAERAVLTMSGAGQRKEGRTGAGYFGYFSRPGQATRTLIAAIVEIGRERLAAGRQRRRGVEPRVERGWVYALLRTFTTVVTRDVSVQGVVNDMCEGRAAIYVDMLGYDEVAHHSGPERVDALAVLRDLDRQVGRIERTATWTPRPYKIVVLSDHGQTQGATFEQRTGQTLAALVAELCGAAASGDADAEAGQHRVVGVAAPRPPPGRLDRRRGRRRPRRARIGKPRPDLDPGRAASPHPRGDRRPVPAADPRTGRPSGDRVRARPPVERIVGRAGQPRQPRSGDRRGGRRGSAGAVRSREPASRSPRSTATRPPPT